MTRGRTSALPVALAAVLAAVPAPATTAVVPLAGGALAAIVLTAAPGCSKKIPRHGELRGRVLPASPGQAVTEEDVRLTAGVVDMAIGGLGIERREVNPLPGGRIRIILPESQAGRVPDVRKLLADPKLRVALDE